MDIVHLSSADLDHLRRIIASGHTARVAIDGGFKISVDSGMWTPPLGITQAELQRRAQVPFAHRQTGA